MDEERCAINRRRSFECFAAGGVGWALLPGALAAVAPAGETITIEMLQAAEKIAGVSFTRDERQRLLEKLNAPHGYLAGFERLRRANLGNATQPAIVFNPVLPGKPLPRQRRPLARQQITVS